MKNRYDKTVFANGIDRVVVKMFTGLSDAKICAYGLIDVE